MNTYTVIVDARSPDGHVRAAVVMSTITYHGHEYDFDAARNLMDDELCERIHGTVENEQEFVDAYAKAHADKYGQAFVIN